MRFVEVVLQRISMHDQSNLFFLIGYVRSKVFIRLWLLVRMLGVGTMVLSPALVITESEIDKLVGILKTSLEHVAEQLGLTGKDNFHR